MGTRRTVLLAAEMSHLEFAAAARKALRAGDIKTAERWMRLSKLQFQISCEAMAVGEKRRERLYARRTERGGKT